jgi:glucose-1-phosphate thymidylyltransferase
MAVKAIIVAGGHGSRLFPLTNHTHKTLLPLFGKPLIDYALATIRQAGIRDITIIGNKFIDKIRKHVGDDVNYVLESEPKGVAAALNLAREGNENCSLLIWFSDNITNLNLLEAVENFSKGAVLLTREVDDPSSFGIAIMKDNSIIDVVEKPKNNVGNLAIGGIYLFDSSFWRRLDSTMDDTSFSISNITRQYIQEGSVKTINVGENTWIDCGTPESIARAGQMVEDGLFDTPWGDL